MTTTSLPRHSGTVVCILNVREMLIVMQSDVMQVWTMLSLPGFSTFIKVWGILNFRLYLIMLASLLSVQILYNFIKS